MRWLTGVLLAIIVAGWACPVSADDPADELVMNGRSFFVTVWEKDGSVRDYGLIMFNRSDQPSGAPVNWVSYLVFGKAWFAGGEWDEWPDLFPNWPQILQWDVWPHDEWYCVWPCPQGMPYEEFTGYYHTTGNFVYGWVVPMGQQWEDRLFFHGRSAPVRSGREEVRLRKLAKQAPPAW